MKTIAYLLFGLAIGFSISDSQARILRVDRHNGALTPDGASWGKAYPTLQWALDEAAPDDEIWVTRNGEHMPERRIDPGEPRSATFSLPRAIRLYGGFAGTEESLEQRDSALSMSTLSGDIGTPGDHSDDAFHVVIASDTEFEAVLDGFVIRDGRADGTTLASDAHGGGLYMEAGHLSVQNCLFLFNVAARGSALFCDACDTSISNCEFRYNNATELGGAVYAEHTRIFFDNCPFIHNTAAHGGALYAQSCRHVLFSWCDFDSNLVGSATGLGGAIFVAGDPDQDSDLRLLGCGIQRSSAHEGGAIYVGDHIFLAGISGSWFNDNFATGSGGAIRIRGTSSSLMMGNASFYDNDSLGTGGAISCEGAFFGAEDTDFYGNFASLGGGAISAKNAENFRYLGGIVRNNFTTDEEGGAFLIDGISGVGISNANFVENYVQDDRWGGGAINIDNAPLDTVAKIDSCRFFDNHAWYGGAIKSNAYSLELYHCDFFDNIAVAKNETLYGGGGIWAVGDIFSFDAGGFTGNMARDGKGGAIYSVHLSASIRDSVFYDNSAYIGGAVYDTVKAGGSVSVYKNCRFVENEAGLDAGALQLRGLAQLDRCVLADNIARRRGSALLAEQSQATLNNCLVTGNARANGAIVSTTGSSPAGVAAPFMAVINSTVAKNVDPPGIAVESGTIQIRNSIVVSNGSPDSPPDDIIVSAGATTDFSYSMLGGSWPGTYLIEPQPQFNNPDNPDGDDGIYGTIDDGLTLRLDSLAINAGRNQFAPPGEDLLAKQRIRDTDVDLGAYEAAFKDRDLDGFSDLAELLASTRADDLNSHPPFVPVIDLRRRSLVFFPKAGESYLIEHSQDLQNWQPFGDPVSWEDAIVTLPLASSSPLLPQDFFRVTRLDP